MPECQQVSNFFVAHNTKRMSNKYILIAPTGKKFCGSIPEIVRAYNELIEDDRFKLRRGGLYRLRRGLAKNGMYKFCALLQEENVDRND